MKSSIPKAFERALWFCGSYGWRCHQCKRSKLCNGRAAGPFRQCRIGWTDAGIDGVAAYDGDFLATVGAFEEVGKFLRASQFVAGSTAWCRPPRKTVGYGATTYGNVRTPWRPHFD